MEKQVKPRTRETPEVILDHENGYMSIKGRSITQETIEFYQPILNWVAEYFKSPQKQTVIELEIEFLNSGSNKLVTDLLKEIKASALSKSELIIKWRYQKDDEDMLFYGKDLEEYSGLTFEYIPFE